MTKIEKILGYMKDDVLPGKRDIKAVELYQIKAMANKPAEEDTLTDIDPDEAILDAIERAYNYGFWMGWKYCEAENDILPGAD